MTVLCVKFHDCAKVGGGQGSPFVAQLGLGGSGAGAQPPGASEHCATTTIALTTPPQGSSCEDSLQAGRPRQLARA
jgi:hypothetical protein